MKSSLAAKPFLKNIRTFSVLALTLFSVAALAQTPPETPPQTPPQAPPPQTPPPQTQTQVQTTSQAQDLTLPKMRFGMKIQPALGWISTDSKDYESNGSEFRFAWAAS
jgi:hypothetical protein